MLGNILGSFISMLIGGNIMYYAWSMPLWPRFFTNALGLLVIYMGLHILYISFKDIGLLPTDRYSL